MKIKVKFKLEDGETIAQPGNAELQVVGNGVNTYLWIGGKGCYATLSGMKTLETLATSIYRALGHQPMWIKDLNKKIKK